MLRFHDGIPLNATAPQVCGDTGSTIEHFHSLARQAENYFFPNQVKRHGIAVRSVGNQIVKPHAQFRSPYRRLIRNCGQRLHKFAFLFQIRASPASLTLFERTPVEFLQLFRRRFLRLLNREELALPQSRQNPCGREFYRPFRQRLVFRMFHPRRNNRRVIVFRHLLIAPVQYRFVARIALYARFQVVRNQQTRYAAEVIVGVNMAEQPRFQLRVSAYFRVRQTTARQNGDKQIRLGDFARHRVVDVQRIPGPVYLHGVPRLMLDAHGRLRNPRPLAVFLAELRVHIRRGLRLLATLAVFRPQKRQIHARFRQLRMDIRVIRRRVHRLRRKARREQDASEFLIRHAFVQRPRHPRFFRRPLHLADGIPSTVYHSRDLPLSVLGVAAQPQDFPVVHHYDVPLGC